MDLKLSAVNLKNILWETLNQLKNKEIDVREADSIAIQAREIIRVNSSQVEICDLANLDLPDEIKEYAGGKEK